MLVENWLDCLYQSAMATSLMAGILPPTVVMRLPYLPSSAEIPLFMHDGSSNGDSKGTIGTISPSLAMSIDLDIDVERTKSVVLYG